MRGEAGEVGGWDEDNAGIGVDFESLAYEVIGGGGGAAGKVDCRGVCVRGKGFERVEGDAGGGANCQGREELASETHGG